MPDFVHGRNTVIYYRGWNIGQFLKEVSWVGEVDSPETTAFGAQVRSYVVGFPNHTASMSGMYSSTTVDPLVTEKMIDDFLDAALGTPTPGWLLYGPIGGVVESPLKAGYSHNNNYSVTGGSMDVVAVSADFEISGFFYGNARVIVSPTNTKQGNATHNWDYDRGVGFDSSRLEFRFFAQGLNTSDVSVTMTLKHSVDNSAWVALGSATDEALAGETWELAWQGTTLQRYLRVEIVVAGAAGTPVFSILAGLYESAT